MGKLEVEWLEVRLVRPLAWRLEVALIRRPFLLMFTFSESAGLAEDVVCRRWRDLLVILTQGVGDDSGKRSRDVTWLFLVFFLYILRGESRRVANET